jgi:hypothetical protein
MEIKPMKIHQELKWLTLFFALSLLLSHAAYSQDCTDTKQLQDQLGQLQQQQEDNFNILLNEQYQQELDQQQMQQNLESDQ